jgi:hypothetical protein
MTMQNAISLKNKYQNYKKWYKKFFNFSKFDYDYDDEEINSVLNADRGAFQQYSRRKNQYLKDFKNKIVFNLNKRFLEKFRLLNSNIYKIIYPWNKEMFEKYSINELLNNNKDGRSITKNREAGNWSFLDRYSNFKSEISCPANVNDKISINIDYKYKDFIKLGSNKCDDDSCFGEYYLDRYYDKRLIAKTNNSFVLNFYKNKKHFGRCFGRINKNQILLRNFYCPSNRVILKSLSYLFFTKQLKKDLIISNHQQDRTLKDVYHNQDQICFNFK